MMKPDVRKPSSSSRRRPQYRDTLVADFDFFLSNFFAAVGQLALRCRREGSRPERWRRGRWSTTSQAATPIISSHAVAKWRDSRVAPQARAIDGLEHLCHKRW